MRPVLFAALLCGSALASDSPVPERQVQANVITSQRDPKIRIKLPSSVQYVGADRWPLYDIADCELHVFVDATPQKEIERLYWVQFEAYLPSRPELHHWSFVLIAFLLQLQLGVVLRGLSNAGGISGSREWPAYSRT